MFSEKDKRLLQEKGISEEILEQQIEHFRNDFPPVRLASPATIGNGLICLTEEESMEYIRKYESSLEEKQMIRFVPASGAATRMFKEIYAFLEACEEDADQKVLLNQSPSVQDFFNRLNQFAFYDELSSVIQAQGESLMYMVNSGRYKDVLGYLVGKPGLGYGNLPKGLLKFHSYETFSRTSFEEHMVEAANLVKDANGIVRLHFTVSQEHIVHFHDHLESVREHYERLFNATFQVRFSVQKEATDTIAVDLNNEPFRNDNGEILFRPGGHGALLENLNEIEGDLILIKNIDNIAPDRIKDETIRYKKILAGVLLSYQEKIFNYLQKLEQQDQSSELIDEICQFLTKNTGDFLSKKDPQCVKDEIIARLNRPIRICGMVKNEGEPGGGPFWVKHTDGSTSLQIVESSQIDFDDKDQAEIFQQSTHFNPVDLACGIKDYKGNEFDLTKYRDPSTGFITEKSIGSHVIKAQELPGLWNGAMAYWNTLFVEVPIETFTPVKTINDLLRPEHQG